MAQIESKALPEIQYSGGHKRLRSIQTLSPNMEKTKNAVTTMTPEGEVVGYTSGPRMGTLDFEAVRYVPLEVNWEDLANSDEEFRFDYTATGGTRYTCLMVVDKVSHKFDAQGNPVIDSVSTKIRNRRKLG